MHELQRLDPHLDGEALKRAVLDTYELIRLTNEASSFLDACMQLNGPG
jgi:hypothetical protein